MKWYCSAALSGLTQSSNRGRARCKALSGWRSNRRAHPATHKNISQARPEFKTEIGRIARDIPVDEFRCACFTEPFTQFIARFRLCELRNPAPQESLALRIGEAEKIVRCGFAHGRRAGEY